MKVLITGGAGFIGSHIAEALAKKGYEVIIFDNFSTGSQENIKNFSCLKNIKVIDGDVLDQDLLLSAIKGADVVSHQAAQLEIGSAINDSIKDARLNIEGTINVLEAAKKAGVKKVIYASSAGIYGEAIKIPQDEDHPKRPQWPYGVSKYSGELYCQQYALLYGMKTCALRYGIVYGEREWYGRVLTEFIKRVVLENKPPVVFGDGMQRRDYVYVKDLVEFHNMLIEEEWEEFEVFNVGGGSSITIKELAGLVAKLAESDLDPIFEDPPEGEYSKLTGRWRIPRELRILELDISRAMKRGWRPKTSLVDGIRNEIEWVRLNPHRWSVKARV
ncbi:MAG: NAD-dependent epimerase/dehydratase family protein [Candidatus Methanomethyliaceae archaeon]